MIVGSAVGGLLALCSVLAAGCGSERRSWEQAEGIGSQQAYEDLLARHADGPYADSARARIEGLQFDAALHANSISGYQQFLSRHPSGQRADSVQKLLDSLYYARARDAGALTETLYYQRPGTPRVLSKGRTVIARRQFVSDRYLTIDAASGDTIHVATLGGKTVSYEAGDVVVEREIVGLLWLCLDENGSIVRDSAGPTLVKPFPADVFSPPAGTQVGWSFYDLGSPSQEISLIFGCANCVKETGITNCVYVW